MAKKRMNRKKYTLSFDCGLIYKRFWLYFIYRNKGCEKSLVIFDLQVDLEIHNTGQDIKVEFLDSSPPLILSGGPLSYDYRIFGALIKFGSDSTRGSDHQIDGFSFPAEVSFSILWSDKQECTFLTETYSTK